MTAAVGRLMDTSVKMASPPSQSACTSVCGCSLGIRGHYVSWLGLSKGLCAYAAAEVEGHPFDIDTMLFMDWRDDHLADLPEVKARNDKLPTFLYAMPFSKNKVCMRPCRA